MLINNLEFGVFFQTLDKCCRERMNSAISQRADVRCDLDEFIAPSNTGPTFEMLYFDSIICSNDLLTPFLTKAIGPMQVLSTNLKCEKQPDGKYLYEYSVQVHPRNDDDAVSGDSVLLHNGSRSCMGDSMRSSDCKPPSENSTYSSDALKKASISRSFHSEAECIFMYEVCFVLFHRNMNGRAQLRLKDEFPCSTTVRDVIDYFRIETEGVHRGIFAPRLAYALGRTRSGSYPLLDRDLDKTLTELCGDDMDINTITIIADVTR